MALVKCHECGKEISSEAKSCPQCGAKNKNYKNSKIIILSVLFLILFGIYFTFEHELNPNIPTCESSHGSKVFLNMVENSPWAKANFIEVIDIIEQKDISSGPHPDDRVCEVTFRLNNGTNKTYIFTFEDDDKPGYITRARLK